MRLFTLTPALIFETLPVLDLTRLREPSPFLGRGDTGVATNSPWQTEYPTLVQAAGEADRATWMRFIS